MPSAIPTFSQCVGVGPSFQPKFIPNPTDSVQNATTEFSLTNTNACHNIEIITFSHKNSSKRVEARPDDAGQRVLCVAATPEVPKRLLCSQKLWVS